MYTPTTPSTSLPAQPHKNFERIRKIDADGTEYWEARELMKLLEYAEWRNFDGVIDKAKEACSQSGQNVSDHFVDINKMVDLGSGSQREIKDYKLSRYACYLVAQNGDPEKLPIALAQTYFAIQSRKQELLEGLSDDEKRLLVRNEVVTHNKKLFKDGSESWRPQFWPFQ